MFGAGTLAAFRVCAGQAQVSAAAAAMIATPVRSGQAHIHIQTASYLVIVTVTNFCLGAAAAIGAWLFGFPAQAGRGGG
jgi:predicted PurR-regulated permease PerM